MMMAINMLGSLLTPVGCALLLVILAPDTTAGTLLRDDFNGTSLDLAICNIVADQENIFVANGLLQSTGGDHNEIASIQTFGTDVVASARILLGGQLNRFGFYSHSIPSGSVVYWSFDTYANRFGPIQNQINMVSSFCSGSNCFDVINGVATVDWSQFHTFTIKLDSAGRQRLLKLIRLYGWTHQVSASWNGSSWLKQVALVVPETRI